MKVSVGLPGRSEEHTSELQSRGHLVCRLLRETKKDNRTGAPPGDGAGHVAPPACLRFPPRQCRGVVARSSAITAALFFFHDTATTEIYTLSLHDALPI